jgi:hypothetical protein
MLFVAGIDEWSKRLLPVPPGASIHTRIREPVRKACETAPGDRGIFRDLSGRHLPNAVPENHPLARLDSVS